MNLAQRALGKVLSFALRGAKIAGVQLRSDEVSRLFGLRDTASGEEVTETTALNYSAFWAGTRLLSETTGSLPIGLFQWTDPKRRSREQQFDHRAAEMFDLGPNVDMAPMPFVETLTSHAVMRGNGYAEIERDGSDGIVNLWPCDPSLIKREPGKDYYNAYQPDGKPPVKIPARNMVHVPGLGFDGITGYDVITMARETIGLGLATERYGATYFGNGSAPGGALETDESLKPEVVKNLRESFEEYHLGARKGHRLAVLTHGLKYKPIVANPANAQFLETRTFNVVEIARWLRVPPHMIAELSRSTNNNIEQQSLEFLTYSLRPWLTRWCQELRRKLLTPEEQKTHYFDFNVKSLLVADIETRFKAHAVARQWGWMSANDILAEENMNPLPDGQAGDTYFVPVNMQTAALALKGGLKNASGTPNNPDSPGYDPVTGSQA